MVIYTNYENLQYTRYENLHFYVHKLEKNCIKLELIFFHKLEQNTYKLYQYTNNLN